MYRIIFDILIVVQYTIPDFLENVTAEVIDCRTIEGQQRYKQLFGIKKLYGMIRTYNYTVTSFKSNLWSVNLITTTRHLLHCMNERIRRLFAGFLTLVFPIDAMHTVALITEMTYHTINRGREELFRCHTIVSHSIRQHGGGRITVAGIYPEFLTVLDELLVATIAGNPMNEQKWVRKDIRWFREQLAQRKIFVSLSTILKYFKKKKISLRRNKKSKSTKNHPLRDGQFQMITRQKKLFLRAGKPCISIDVKKKEKIGDFLHEGKTWQKEPIAVLDHDFASSAKGIFIPFGIYDIQKNTGFVTAGISHETSEFLVDGIVSWWEKQGCILYPDAKELLIFCDAGGANGYRRYGWKYELQEKFVDRFHITVTVCHYPTGTSKWNPIEHKLFSYISKNWAGEPLVSYEKALEFIRSTTTQTGLHVYAELNPNSYPTKKTYTKEQIDSLNILPEDFFPFWNYTIRPRLKTSV